MDCLLQSCASCSLPSFLEYFPFVPLFLLQSPETFTYTFLFYSLLKACKFSFAYGATSQIITQLLRQQLDTLPFLQFTDYSFLKVPVFPIEVSCAFCIVAGESKIFLKTSFFLDRQYVLNCACPTCR